MRCVSHHGQGCVSPHTFRKKNFDLLEVASVTNPTDFNQFLLPDPGIPTICASELEWDSAPIHKGRHTSLFGF